MLKFEKKIHLQKVKGFKLKGSVFQIRDENLIPSEVVLKIIHICITKLYKHLLISGHYSAQHTKLYPWKASVPKTHCFLSFSDLDYSTEVFCGEGLLPSFSWPCSSTVDFSKTVTNEAEELARTREKIKDRKKEARIEILLVVNG